MIVSENFHPPQHPPLHRPPHHLEFRPGIVFGTSEDLLYSVLDLVHDPSANDQFDTTSIKDPNLKTDRLSFLKKGGVDIMLNCYLTPHCPPKPHMNPDLYFFFGGFHLLYSVYMIIGIPGTGSAGLIQTIRLFTNHTWAAAVLGLIATVGWTLQGVGNAFYYRKIYRHNSAAGHSMEKAKGELATHGAKAYFTRG